MSQLQATSVDAPRVLTASTDWLGTSAWPLRAASFEGPRESQGTRQESPLTQ